MRSLHAARAKRVALLDFVIEAEEHTATVDNDEYQHSPYDQTKELEREQLLLELWPRKLHLIRLNPDAFTLEECRRG